MDIMWLNIILFACIFITGSAWVYLVIILWKEIKGKM